MNEPPRIWHWIVAACMLLAIWLQAVIAHRLQLGPGQPDFPLTVALVTGALGGPLSGATSGFFAGLATAGLTGEAVGTIFVSRTSLAWSAGALVRLWIRPGILVAVTSAGLGTMASGLLLALAAPSLGATNILLSTLAETPLNMASALPVAWLLALPRFAGASRGS